jgi:hypothetical protein
MRIRSGTISRSPDDSSASSSDDEDDSSPRRRRLCRRTRRSPPRTGLDPLGTIATADPALVAVATPEATADVAPMPPIQYAAAPRTMIAPTPYATYETTCPGVGSPSSAVRVIARAVDDEDEDE